MKAGGQGGRGGSEGAVHRGASLMLLGEGRALRTELHHIRSDQLSRELLATLKYVLLRPMLLARLWREARW
eukprot:911129-Pyramimonas_sp.AAC.1